MKKKYSFLITKLILLSFIILAESCSKVPVTGRRQMKLLPESQLIGMSLTSYNEFMASNPKSTNSTNSKMVKDIGANISNAVKEFLKSKGKSSIIKDYQWEYNLIADKTPNAWCMPGGKIVVYEGILPYTKTADGLAVVIGHEVAHAVAKHGNERMSQQIVTQYGLQVLSTFLQDQPETSQIIFQQALGLGAQYGVMLPYSRLHEYEADKMGLVFMAKAGYDPNAAVAFWERMSKTGGQKPPEFMSTHPSDEKRIKELKKFLPEAMKYYKK